MASLPAKPQGSPSQDASNRYQDERDRRPSRPLSYRTDDRPYSNRRWPPGGDSYAPAYDSRREPEFHRRDIDKRERASWDRPHNLDNRFGRGSSDYDRDRRVYDRRAPYVSNPRHSREPNGWRDTHGWRSRSPSRRDRSRSRSPYLHKRVKLGNHSVDTSPRRSSPHRPSRYSRSRSRDASWRRRSRSPRPEPAAFSNSVKTEGGVISDPVTTQDPGLSQTTTTTHALEAPHQDRPPSGPPRSLRWFKKEEEDVKIPADEEVKPQTEQTLSVVKNEPSMNLTGVVADQHPAKLRSPILPTHSHPSPEQKHTFPSHLQEPLNDTQIGEHGKSEGNSPLMPSQPRGRSPSPPRQPRQRGPHGPLPYPRYRFRSPPKGPRNYSGAHPRGHITPTGPASSHPPGPRGQRRPLPPPNLLSNTVPQSSTPQTQSPVTPSLPAPMEDIKPMTAPTQAPEVVKVPLPVIPIKQLPPSLTQNLDKEIYHLQLQRARLATDYTNLAKDIRRALHELDTTTIDLHAAELRRKVADTQHEKARNGLLGIDYVPTEAEARTST